MSRSSPRHGRAAAALLAAVLAAAGLVVVAAPPAAAYPSDVVEFEGQGWGHGRGLGQYGSLGYAIDHGWDYRRIVDHFYGGTTHGTFSSASPISVQLKEHDSETSAPKDLVVTSAAGFTIGSEQYGPGRYGRVRWNGAGWDIDEGGSCTGPWTNRVKVGGDARPQATTSYSGDDVASMLNLCGANRRAYRGSIMILIADVKFIRVVNHVPMEQYLRGVVPRESPASWADLGGGKGIEALKAQAIAARSYAWAENRHPLFKTCDTTACQVYGGAGLNGARIEDPRSDRAISATAEQVRLLNGRPARTEFSSSTGGYTAGGTFPAVVDDGDDTASNPFHRWKISVPVATVEAAFPSIGTLQRVEVTSRNGVGDGGGRARQVRITGTNGTVNTTGDAVRSALGLRSDWFFVLDPALNTPAVAVGRAGSGYVLASTAGEAMGGAGASTFGSMEGRSLPADIVGMATSPTGKGYWLAGSDGSVYAFGDAPYQGSMGGKRLARPIVGIAATTTGKGYWLVASDGGIFSFGDARFLGSMGGRYLAQPIVGMAADPDGRGYWFVARDGGIFSFEARFHGSTGAIRLAQPIVGMTPRPDGTGYWFVAADGGVFTYPNDASRFYGSLGGRRLPAPVVGMAATGTGKGYWLVGRDGAVYRFGDAG